MLLKVLLQRTGPFLELRIHGKSIHILVTSKFSFCLKNNLCLCSNLLFTFFRWLSTPSFFSALSNLHHNSDLYLTKKFVKSQTCLIVSFYLNRGLSNLHITVAHVHPKSSLKKFFLKWCYHCFYLLESSSWK